VQELKDAIARLRIATWAEDGDAVDGLEEALRAWGPDAPKVAHAAVALDDGQPEVALERLETASVMQPMVRHEAAILRAEALLELGKTADALAALDGKDGDDVAVVKAKALARSRRVDEAVALIDGVLARDPSHWEARYGRAVLWLGAGRASEALDILGALIQENPLDPRPYRATIKVFLVAGDPAAAIPLVEGLIENPLLGSPALAMDLAELYAATGDTDRLPTVLSSVTRAARVGAVQALALATLWQEVPSSGAIRHLRDAFDGAPVASVLEALALEVEGRDEEAVALFEASGVDHWLVHERIAAHRLGTDRELALGHLERAMSLGRNPAIRLTKAVADLATEPERAVEELEFARDNKAFRPTIRRRAALALDAFQG
jgi:thioredoxin-like negative regulator of GroEL